jgi:hypothetical protein
MQTFANKAKSLRQRGWADDVVTGTIERPSERTSTAFLISQQHAHKV